MTNSIRFHSTKRASALFILLYYIARACHSPGPTDPQAVELMYTLPIVNLNGEFIAYQDSFAVFYRDSFVLYRIPYEHTITSVTADTLGRERDDENVVREVRYRYFVFHKGDAYGYQYDSAALDKYQRRVVDSFLAARTFSNMDIFNAANDSLVFSQVAPAGELFEKYIPKIKYDRSYNDTSYFYYTDRIRNPEFSLSRELDSIKEMKLYKARLWYKASDNLPDHELSFELKPLSTAIQKELGQRLDQLQKELY